MMCFVPYSLSFFSVVLHLIFSAYLVPSYFSYHFISFLDCAFISFHIHMNATNFFPSFSLNCGSTFNRNFVCMSPAGAFAYFSFSCLACWIVYTYILLHMIVVQCSLFFSFSLLCAYAWWFVYWSFFWVRVELEWSKLR